MATTIEAADAPKFDLSNFSPNSPAPATTETKKETQTKDDKPVAQGGTIKPDDAPDFDLSKLGQETEQKKPNYIDDEESEESVDSTDNTDDSNNESDNDVEVVDEDVVERFNSMKELGYFRHLPDDFEFDGSDAKIQEAFMLEQQGADQQAELRVVSQIQDPLVRELLEFGIQGGSGEQLKDYFLKQVEVEESKPVLNTVEDKESFITKWQKALGNPDRIIKMVIEDAQDNESHDEMVEEASKFFSEKAKVEKQAQREAALKQHQARQQQQADYNRKFMDVLNNTEYTKAKKSEIVSAFDSIPLKNGGSMVKFQLQRAWIENNPQHFIQYLDILNRYHPEKGFDFSNFKQAVVTDATKEVKSKFLGKGTKRKSASGSTQPQSNTPQPLGLLQNIERG